MTHKFHVAQVKLKTDKPLGGFDEFPCVCLALFGCLLIRFVS